MAFIHGLGKLCMMRTKVLCAATSKLGNIVLVKVGYFTVADSGGVRGVQMHPTLAASNVFLRK